MSSREQYIGAVTFRARSLSHGAMKAAGAAVLAQRRATYRSSAGAGPAPRRGRVRADTSVVIRPVAPVRPTEVDWEVVRVGCSGSLLYGYPSSNPVVPVRPRAEAVDPREHRPELFRLHFMYTSQVRVPTVRVASPWDLGTFAGAPLGYRSRWPDRQESTIDRRLPSICHRCAICSTVRRERPPSWRRISRPAGPREHTHCRVRRLEGDSRPGASSGHRRRRVACSSVHLRGHRIAQPLRARTNESNEIMRAPASAAWSWSCRQTRNRASWAHWPAAPGAS